MYIAQIASVEEQSNIGLRASQRGLKACQSLLGGLRRGGGRMYGCTDGFTDKHTDVRNFSPFYRTLFPVGAAAQKEGAAEKQRERERERLTDRKIKRQKTS